MKEKIEDIKKDWEAFIVDCQSKEYNPPNPNEDPIDYLTWNRNRDELNNKLINSIIDTKIRLKHLEDHVEKTSMKKLFSFHDIKNSLVTLSAMGVLIYGCFVAFNWLIGVWFMNDVKFNKNQVLLSIEERNERRIKENEFRLILNGKRERFLMDTSPIATETSSIQAGLDFVSDLHELTLSKINKNEGMDNQGKIVEINKLRKQLKDANLLIKDYEYKSKLDDYEASIDANTRRFVDE